MSDDGRPTGIALFSLVGRTALVTGSSRGIGNALAAGLAPPVRAWSSTGGPVGVVWKTATV